jgi:hypothetical protein
MAWDLADELVSASSQTLSTAMYGQGAFLPGEQVSPPLMEMESLSEVLAAPTARSPMFSPNLQPSESVQMAAHRVYAQPPKPPVALPDLEPTQAEIAGVEYYNTDGQEYPFGSRCAAWWHQSWYFRQRFCSAAYARIL